MSEKVDLFEKPEVQYGDFKGEIAVDIADVRHLEDYIGLDSPSQILIRLELRSYGGHQTAKAYYADLGSGNIPELIQHANTGIPIKVWTREVINWEPKDHSDTNPPHLKEFPAKSITELFEHAFKSLELTLICNADKFPASTILEIMDGEVE